MENQSKAVFTLKIIGSLFSVVSLLLIFLCAWLFFDVHETANHVDYKGFLVATGILAMATMTISIFIWWIVSNKRKFLNYD